MNHLQTSQFGSYAVTVRVYLCAHHSTCIYTHTLVQVTQKQIHLHLGIYWSFPSTLSNIQHSSNACMAVSYIGICL